MATTIHTGAPSAPKVTTILGKTYAGLPTGLAFSVWNLERQGQPEKAQALLDAHNRIRRAFGSPDYDIADDMTELPFEGGFVFRMGRRA